MPPFSDQDEDADNDDDDNNENCDKINLLKQKHDVELNVLRQKGSSKGSKGKGRKGAARGDLRASTSGTPKFDCNCRYCKKRGHKRKNCRKRMLMLVSSLSHP